MARIDPDQVIWNEVDGNVILLQFASGDFFVLNDVGSRIWKLLDEGKSLTEAVDILHGEYDVPRERLEQDVDEFMSAAANTGLICV